MLPDAVPGRAEGRPSSSPTCCPARINLGLVVLRRHAPTCSSPPTARPRAGQAGDRQPAAGGVHRDRRGDLHLAATRSSIFARRRPPRATSRRRPASCCSPTARTPSAARSPPAIAAAQAAHVQVSTIAFGTADGTVTGDNGEQVPVPADNADAAADRGADRRLVPHRDLGAGAAERSTRTSARRSATPPSIATSAGASSRSGCCSPLPRPRRRCSGPAGWSDRLDRHGPGAMLPARRAHPASIRSG